MEVLIPTPPAEFNFDSSTTSPYISAPSSPQRFGAAFFFSAPTSPTQASAFYKDFTTDRDRDQYVSGVPFDWEVTPGTPKSLMERVSVADTDADEEDEDSRDFAFDFSGHMDTVSLTDADELFDGGKIKPLKPPPRLQFHQEQRNSPWSPKSPRSPKKSIKDALSPRHKKYDFDPFAAAHEQTCRESTNRQQQRGRERTNNSSSYRQKKTRSLSPYRVSDLLIEPQEEIVGNANGNGNETRAKQSTLFPNSPSFSSFWYKKWKLKDLLLFRSASEGRASASKDQMKKYAMLKRNNYQQQQEDLKNTSFRSTDSMGSTTSSSSCSRRRGAVSAHEMHYTVNRAVTEEMKKKTFLPYKRSLLGCMGFRSGMPIHEISKGLGSLHRSSRG